jgi:hypothetical protein
MAFLLGSVQAIVAALAVALGSIFVVSKLKQRDQSLPPGPIGLPWLGVGLRLPTDGSWGIHTQWAKQYGRSNLSQFLSKKCV